MPNHFDRMVDQLQATQAAVGTTPPSTDPMTRQGIESFIAGFALSAAAQRKIVERWAASQDAAHREGYDSGARDSEPW